MAKRKFDRTEYPTCPADDELKYLIRARYNLIYAVTWEEQRVIDSLAKICDNPDIELKGVHVWDGARGMTDHRGAPISDAEGINDVEGVLDYILKKAEDQRGAKKKDKSGRGPIYVLCDIFRFLENRELSPFVERKIRTLSSYLKQTTIYVVMVSPKLELPTALEKCVTVVDYPLPNKAQLGVLVENCKQQILGIDLVPEENLREPKTEKIADALLGLTFYEAEDALAKAIVKKARFDIDILNDIKQQVIRKGELLDFVNVKETMDTVGGFDGLKEFIKLRKAAFSENAKKYGLPIPKGVFLLGIQGSGKSLSAKAIAHELQVPLLKMDMGSMFSQWVGSSEQNVRRALDMAESVAPCVLLVDEIDKALAGSTSTGESSSGTTRRVVGYLVEWMQRKESPVFVVACANSVRGIPPEILRKGRFDELFFVDLPEESERRKIFEIHIAKRKRDPANFDVEELAKRAEDFSGAEIENCVEDAMFMAFADGEREFTTDDMVRSIANCKPLAKLDVMKETIDQLREEADGRMRKVRDPLYRELDETSDGDGGRFVAMGKG